MRHCRTRLFHAVCAALCAGLSVAPAAAQEPARPAAPPADAAQDTGATTLETVSVLGSRRVQRSSDTASMSPVDVLPMTDAAEEGAQFDLAQTLQYTVPSFTSTRQTGADGADLVDGAALRGLGSDQTLVLVNGKRHHTVALVNIYGARNRGNTGTDLNAFPLLAIDRVEVLRDGAAAQYGSDAIAGVMNIVLKRRKGCEAIAGYGEYGEGDGENWIASAYCGAQLATGGMLAITGEWLDRGRSDRSEPPGSPRIIGDSKVENRTVYLNGDSPLGEAAELYFTAGLQDRDASSAAFAREGLGSEDIPSRNSAAMYPDGFVPFIDGDVQDRYGIVGLRGDAGPWRWDVSHTYGYNELRYTINRTLNASLANLDLLNGGAGVSQASFDAGGFSFEQNTSNLDVSRYFDGVLHGFNLAFGLERREERYRIRAGEPGSYLDYDGPDGGNPGSQGFPGFQPSDATDRKRDSWAGYVDVEVDFNDRFMMGMAARYEDYSDFGQTLDGKLSFGFRATDAVMLRGSLSTGFRAPSLQQKYFSSTITDFISGEPVDVVIASNDSALARAVGLPNLTEETSQSATLGLTWTPSDAFSLTLDAYRIDIDDRIVLSGEFDTSDPTIGPILEQMGVGLARFFFNSVDTKTQGADLTATYGFEWAGAQWNAFLGANYSKTEVTRVHTPPALAGREDVLLSERDRLFVENGAPRSKAVLGLDYVRGPWQANVKGVYFGEQTLGTFSGTAAGVPNQHYASKASADVSLTYAFSEDTKFTVGGANVFDQYPTRQNPDETDNGHVFESVQFGLNGAAWYVRLWHRF
ncbi:TonB-dependent receptor plug domain-containing protein [Vulcaniibacterium tengchongense]|uniref:Iron complex outermembrane receptor protein n=1 Tax=Vulcaniibacterium tengchongense TaxID=1273429 RepID=A0A3N4V2N5_9GAMM|nr:TonB-dependent receptor [Vulcaniibacterium tengchongense]RPE77216.1 iron complex outermembrane receptor protein [Vulcaniibacterium tengchongense]